MTILRKYCNKKNNRSKKSVTFCTKRLNKSLDKTSYFFFFSEQRLVKIDSHLRSNNMNYATDKIRIRNASSKKSHDWRSNFFPSPVKWKIIRRMFIYELGKRSNFYGFPGWIACEHKSFRGLAFAHVITVKNKYVLDRLHRISQLVYQPFAKDKL